MPLACKARLIRLVVGSLIAWVLTAVTAIAESRVALVVGNSAYKSVAPLENPINDALDISVALEGLGFEVILGSNQGKDQMRTSVAAFSRAASTADVALFYYAGHGFQVAGENYLVPIDAQIAAVGDVPDQTIPMDDILKALEQAPGLKLIFLDACRDNPFGENLIDDPLAGSGLAREGNDANFLFVYATQPDNVAYDGTGRNSFFTEALLSHIYTPGQDIADLMINVRRDVLSATGGRQIPWENSSLTRQFQFDTNPLGASEETLLWQVAANEGDPELLQLYADRFPQGAHLEDVLAFLETDDQTRTLTPVDDVAEADKLWQLARRSRLRPLISYYIKRYPDGRDVAEATALLDLIPTDAALTPGDRCERLATHPRDATAVQPGVPFAVLQRNAPAALQACSAAAAQSPDLPHYAGLLARAIAATGDFERAAQLYESAADRGDLRAMVSLAQLRENGLGVPQDQVAAFALYESASAAGSPDAMTNLAVLLFEGTLSPADPDRAIALLRKAVENGSAEAAYNLGFFAQDGMIETPEDALQYFDRAARGGFADGYRAAAILLDEGRGVARDPQRASALLLRAVAEDRGTTLQQFTAATDEWTPATLRATQERLSRAGFYDGAIDGVVGPNLINGLKSWRNGGFTVDVLTD